MPASFRILCSRHCLGAVSVEEEVWVGDREEDRVQVGVRVVVGTGVEVGDEGKAACVSA